MRNISPYSCQDLHTEYELDIEDELWSNSESEPSLGLEVDSRLDTEETSSSFLMNIMNVIKFPNKFVSFLMFFNLIATVRTTRVSNTILHIYSNGGHGTTYDLHSPLNKRVCALLAIEGKFLAEKPWYTKVLYTFRIQNPDFFLSKEIYNIIENVHPLLWLDALSSLLDGWMKKLKKISSSYHSRIESMLEARSESDYGICPGIKSYLRDMDNIIDSITTTTAITTTTTTTTTVKPTTVLSTITTDDADSLFTTNHILLFATYGFLMFFLIILIIFFRSNNEKIINARRLLGSKIGRIFAPRKPGNKFCARSDNNGIEMVDIIGTEGGRSLLRDNGTLVSEDDREAEFLGDNLLRVKAQVYVVDEGRSLLHSSDGQSDIVDYQECRSVYLDDDGRCSLSQVDVISQEEDCYYQCDESEAGSFQEVAGVGCSSQANSSSSSLVVERCYEVEVDDTSSDARRIATIVQMCLLNEEVNREMHDGDQEEDSDELEGGSFHEVVAGVGCSSQASSSSSSLIVEKCAAVEVDHTFSDARRIATIVQMCLLKEEVNQRVYT